VFVGLSRTLANLGMTFYVYQGMPIRRQYMQWLRLFSNVSHWYHKLIMI